jgi:hypothetical protein
VCGRVAAMAEEEACTRGRAVVAEQEASLSSVDGSGGDWWSSRERVAGT